MLTLLTTATQPKPNYNSIYLNAFKRVIENITQNPDRENLKKAVFHGIRYIVTAGEVKDLQQASTIFGYISMIEQLLSYMTPAELLQIFPVAKEYDGERYGVKDYFYTIQAINEMGLHEPIGDKVHDLLWDYQNHDIARFMVATLSTASDIRRMQGKPGLMEEWAMQEGIPLYYEHTDSNGKKYMQDSNGKTMAVKRKMPRYISRIK